MKDHTHGHEQLARYRLLSGTPLSEWKCPACGDVLALWRVMKLPRELAYRVRLVCSRITCQGSDLALKLTDPELVRKLVSAPVSHANP